MMKSQSSQYANVSRSKRRSRLQTALGLVAVISGLAAYGLHNQAVTTGSQQKYESELDTTKAIVHELTKRLEIAKRDVIGLELELNVEKRRNGVLQDSIDKQQQRTTTKIDKQQQRTTTKIESSAALSKNYVQVPRAMSKMALPLEDIYAKTNVQNSARQRMIQPWFVKTNLSKQREDMATRLEKRAAILRHRKSALEEEACESTSANLDFKFIASRLVGAEKPLQCAFGNTRKAQLLRIKQLAHNSRSTTGHVVFTVVDFGTDICMDSTLSHLKNVWSAARTAGLTRTGSFLFVCADGPTLALLCAAGLPAIAASDIAAEQAMAVFRAAAADAALGLGRRRRLQSLMDAKRTESIGSPLADAQVYESMLAESSFFATDSLISSSIKGQNQKLALRLDMAAELSFRGIHSIAIDHAVVHLLPTNHAQAFFDAIFADFQSIPAVAYMDDDEAPAPNALWKHFHRDPMLIDDLPETSNHEGDNTDRSMLVAARRSLLSDSIKKKRPPVRVATRQWAPRIPCPAFIASRAGNSTTRILKKLAKSARTLNSNDAMMKVLATELRLGGRGTSSGGIASTLVACNPRPRLRHPRARFGAVVFTHAFDYHATSILASELGLLKKNKKKRTLALRGGVLDLSDGSPVTRSAKYLRVALSHLVAIALLTDRSLKLPTVFMEGRSYFVWSYLDIGALTNDFGLDLILSESEKELINPTSKATIRPRIHKRRQRNSIQPNLIIHSNPPRFYELRDKFEPQFIYRPEIALFTAAELLNDVSHLSVDLGFLDHHFDKILDLHRRQAFNPATLVANRLKWCDKAFSPQTEVRHTFVTAVCWQRGSILDSYSELPYQIPTTLRTADNLILNNNEEQDTFPVDFMMNVSSFSFLEFNSTTSNGSYVNSSTQTSFKDLLQEDND